MSDRLAIAVNFRSAHGGLHDHVADQVGFATDLGYHVTLACPEGPFAESMRARCDVVVTDFSDIGGTVQRILALGSPALIHAHPGLSRELAFGLKAVSPAPLLVTYHGSRPETLTAADSRIDIAIVVADVTRRFILKRTEADPARVVVIPNAVDTSVFGSASGSVPEADILLLASRWDDDKGFVVDVAREALRALMTSPDLAHVKVVLAGDGQRLPELEDLCRAGNSAHGKDRFRSLGWLSPHDLAREMAASSVVISPGRGALQAMAVGRATIALGSKGYVGYLDGSALLQGMDVNFGSGGIGPRQYPNGLVVSDIRRALAGARDAHLLEAYRAVVESRTMDTIRQAHERVWSIAKVAGRG